MNAICELGRGRTGAKRGAGPSGRPSLGSFGPSALRFGGALLALSVVSEGCASPEGVGAGRAPVGRPAPPGSVEPQSDKLGDPDVVCKLGDEACEESWLRGRVTEAALGGPIGGTGTGPGNGLGLFVVAASNSTYCFADVGGQPAFCPETFFNADPGVYLQLRDANDAFETYVVPVQASVPDAWAPDGYRPVNLIAIHTKGTQLAIEYENDDMIEWVSGDELASIKLDIPAPGTYPFSYSMRVTPSTRPLPLGSAPAPYGLPPPKWLRRYDVEYRIEGTGPAAGVWRPHCTVGTSHRPSSFLGQTMIDGVLGQVGQEPAAVTMACETGAIDTCLAWGYTPAYTPGVEPNPYLYGSCLQAKRAAYFVGPREGLIDLMSYTTNGTPIDVQDVAGIIDEPVEHLEAVWNPDGVACLNPENLRRPEMASHPYFAIPSHVPPCPHDDWSGFGPLATGRRLDL
jgi:hypothetical protein